MVDGNICNRLIFLPLEMFFSQRKYSGALYFESKLLATTGLRPSLQNLDYHRLPLLLGKSSFTFKFQEFHPNLF